MEMCEPGGRWQVRGEHRVSMVAARRLGLAALVTVALICSGETVAVGQEERTDQVVERLEELEEDGLLPVQGRTPQQVLEGLLTAALARDLTSQKAVAMMNRNIESGRTSVEKYIDTWSQALSKALDRAQKRRKERRQERRAEKERAKVRQGLAHRARCLVLISCLGCFAGAPRRRQSALRKRQSDRKSCA